MSGRSGAWRAALGLAISMLPGAFPALAADPVDVELVLAVDVSLSMSPAELDIQRRGYAITIGPRVGRVLGLAVPIRRSRNVFGSLSMRFARAAFTPEQAAARFLEPLNATARSIALAMAAHDDADLAEGVASRVMRLPSV